MIKYVVMALFLLPLMSAVQNETYAYAQVQIINEAPILQEVQFSSTTVYEDMALECLAKVQDEQLPSVQLHYTWTVNGQVIPEKSYRLAGFHEKDEIQCTVYAQDNIHQMSHSQAIQISVSSAPWHAKTLSQALTALGINTDIAHSLRLQDQGAASITGYVIDESDRNGTSGLLMILVGLVFLTLLNMNWFLRYHLKKQPRAG